MIARLGGGADLARRQASEDAFNKAVGTKLRAAREAKGLSQDAVGAKLFCHGSQITRYEDGKVPLTCVRAARLCQLYGIEMASLFR